MGEPSGAVIGTGRLKNDPRKIFTSSRNDKICDGNWTIVVILSNDLTKTDQISESQFDTNQGTQGPKPVHIMIPKRPKSEFQTG